MAKYQYNGDDERSFPTLGITVKKGDTFESPDGLRAPGLSLESSAKSAPAAVASKESKQEQIKSSASSDSNAGA